VIITEQDFVLSPKTTANKQFSLGTRDRVLLMPVGDVHAYSPHWPKERFRDHIKWGLDQGAYFLGMGEYFDFTSGSQRAILGGLRISQKQTIDEMVKVKVEEFAKLIEFSKGRWLGLLEGHHYHEYVNGITTDQHLCQLLECPFLGTSTLFDVNLLYKHGGSGQRAGTTITIYAHHGCGGGRKQGGHLHRVEDLITMIEADIYLMGHSHSKANAPIDRLYRTRSGYLYHRTKLIARTGAFLRGYAATSPVDLTRPAAESRGTYVESAAYVPSSLGGLVISLGMKYLKVQTGPDTRTDEGVRRRKRTNFYIPDIHYSV